MIRCFFADDARRQPTRAGTVRDEGGQVAVLAAFVIALMLMAVVAVGLIGRAIVDRTAATAAADAVALANAVDPSAAEPLARWYEARGYEVTARDGAARASGAEARAHSQAVAEDEVRVAPVVRAIVARAEQLLGRQLFVVNAEGVSVTFSAPSARDFDAIAAELGMCTFGDHTFARC